MTVELNKTQIKAVSAAVKTGFTYNADSVYSSVAAGKKAINSLVKEGFLLFEDNSYGGQYVPTDKAYTYVKYGKYAV